MPKDQKMKKIVLSGFASLLFFNVNAQKFYTKTGKIFFTASSPLENIEATTNKATGVIDWASAKMEVKLLVKSFHMEKALMEEHFNENYMESSKYPEATYVGSITDLGSVDIKKDGKYNVNVVGKMTLHGVTKDLATKGVLEVKDGQIASASAQFKVLVADYNIQVPGAVRDKIAKEAAINVNLGLQPLK